jgi:tight adherence protein B
VPVLPILLTLLLLAILGAALFGALGYARRVRQEREARLGLIFPSRNAVLDAGITEPALAGSGWGAALAISFRHWFSLGLAHNWGMRATPLLLCGMALGGAASAWLLLRTSLHLSLFIAVPAALMMFFQLPRMWLKHEQNGADQKFIAAFPETIDMMIRMLRAGLPVTATIRAIGSEAQPPVNGVFAHIADQMEIGIAFEDALSVAGHDIGLPDFRFFAVSISLQRATGGNLTSTLTILSDVMRKRRAMRQKGRAVTGEVRMSAYVLGGIPFLVIGAMLIVSPHYLQPLLSDRRGNVIVGIAAMMMFAGFAAIRMMLRSVTQV